MIIPDRLLLLLNPLLNLSCIQSGLFNSLPTVSCHGLGSQ